MCQGNISGLYFQIPADFSISLCHHLFNNFRICVWIGLIVLISITMHIVCIFSVSLEMVILDQKLSTKLMEMVKANGNHRRNEDFKAISRPIIIQTVCRYWSTNRLSIGLLSYQ